MEERIYEILSSACIDNRLITKEELKEIFYIYIDINELKDYVNDIEFVSENLNEIVHFEKKENENKDAGAGAFVGEKKIYFDYDKIIKVLKNEENRFLDYQLVMYLLHEINHFEHFKIIDNAINNKDYEYELDAIKTSKLFLILSSYYQAYNGIEDNLFSTMFLRHTKGNDIYEKYRNHYYKNHDLFPCERLADLDAIEYLRKLLFKYETNNDNIIIQHQILLNLKFNSLFKGYKTNGRKLLSPTPEYFKKFNLEKFKFGIKECEDNLKHFNKSQASNLLYLGLHMDIERFNNIYNFYDKATEEPVGLSDEGIKKLTKR